MAGKGFPFAAQGVEVTAAIDDEAKPGPAIPDITVRPVEPDTGATGVYKRPRASCIVDEPELHAVRPWLPQAAKQGSTATLSRGAVPAAAASAPDADDAFAGVYAAWYRRLVESEVRPSIAASIVRKLRIGESDGGRGDEQLRTLLRSRFKVSGPIRCKKRGPMVVAFVGPTGAGKTTTIAKLAATCRLGGNRRRVSIITADTYRIAAVEQIRTFADIVHAELHVVFSPDEVPATMAACVGDDLVLVDTAGRSRRNGASMDELKILLDRLRPDETHLVLSATTKDSDLFDTVERYRAVGGNRLLFTKLDETDRVGNVFNAAAVSELPVSFLAAGQNVPDDIEVAQPGRFVQRLFGQEGGA